MLIDPPAGGHNITLTVDTTERLVINTVFSSNTSAVKAAIKQAGNYTITVGSYNVSAALEVTKVVGFSFSETKEVINEIFNSNVSGQDPIAVISNANPAMLLNILSLPGQDMSGCLSNCSNMGKCTMNAQNKFVCECFRYYRGSMCEIDVRGCTPKPCQNNGTCNEVVLPGQLDQGFSCNCSSPVFFGERCEQKQNVCWNKTCSFQGKCFDNNSRHSSRVLH